ncbi:MAG TPA: HAD-IA family hydrolase [Ktedonobacteraceae bacterium]|nr:HAD-IA family hydrolase [Ktedonobacteraceae bacterium]
MGLEQPQAIRTIFFDAGYTLLHPNPSTAEICQQVCERLHLHLHLDEVKNRMLDAEEYFWRQTRQRYQTWASEETITEFWVGYYMNLLRPFIEEHDEPRLYQLALAITREFDQHTSWQLYPDVLPTLEALRKQNYTLGVISDWGIALSAILRRLRLTDYFDCLLISAATRHAKPSPTLYERALQRANSIADYTLHVGDSYIHDVLGARAVGITPVLLDRQRTLEESNVDCLLVHSLTDLLQLLEIDSPHEHR